MFGVLPFLPPGLDPRKVLPLFADGQGSVAAAASSSTTIVSTNLQSSYVGVILAFGVTVRSVPEYEYTGNLIFRLLVDDGPFLDNNRGTWTTQRGSVLQPIPTLIRVPLGGRISFVVSRSTTAAAQAQTVAFIATGVMWPDTHPLPYDGGRYRV